MIEFYGPSFLASVTFLRELQTVVRSRITTDGPIGELTPQDKKYAARLAEGMQQDCDSIGLEATKVAVSQLYDRCSYQGMACNWQLVAADLSHVFDQLGTEFSRQRFAFIPPDRHRYFGGGNFFRLGSPSPMPSTDQDIEEAGNAFAVGLHTACVFHLMRVAEIGLRALARHLKVFVTKDGKRIPVEWAQWEQILKNIRNKVDAIANPNQPKGAKRKMVKKTPAKKSADLAYYRGLLAEYEGFKDMFRNNVMHVRETYRRDEAELALKQVGAFMERLTTRIHD